MRVPVEQRFRRHHPPVQAIAALERLFLQKRSLNGMRMLRRPEPFERQNILARRARRRQRAGSRRDAVHQNRACAALAEPAAEARVVQSGIVAQDVEQGTVGFDVKRLSLAVDLEREMRHASPRLLVYCEELRGLRAPSQRGGSRTIKTEQGAFQASLLDTLPSMECFRSRVPLAPTTIRSY